MKTKLCNQIATTFPDISSDTITKLLELPPEPSMGDFAYHVFPFPKPYGKALP